MRTNFICVLGLLIFAILVPRSAAQKQSQPQITLRQVTHSAGYIFTARVKSVQYLPAASSSYVATVRVRFQVERGLRGVRNGREFTIRQWAGLDGGDRYRVGERLLLFLYPASKLGLTSPVGGPRGRYALDHNGNVLLGMETTEVFRDGRARQRDRVPLREFIRGLRRIEEE